MSLEPPAPVDHPAGRYLLRPAVPADLAALERLAQASAIGISSLPTSRSVLLDKLERSARAFASEDEASGEELYLFVLEDLAQGGAIVGTSGIEASPGFHDRFYCYRNEFTVQVSAELGTRNRIHTLNLCHDLSGVSLLTGFFIDPAHAEGPAPQLLSRGRLLFMAQFAERFAERVASENPGLADENGQCPFWDAVGRRFFDMDYPSAEALTSGRDKAYIAELMPQSPIYVPLLDEQAQWALGQLHPVAELPFTILLDEGFEADTYVNIFDGGPTVEAALSQARSVRRARRLSLHEGARPAGWQLLASGSRANFRATLAELSTAGPVELAALAALLAVGEGARLLATPLDLAGPAAEDVVIEEEGERP